MRSYSLITLFLFLLTGVNVSVIAAWQEGEFTGELNWKGTVSQTRNPWLWSQPTLPDMPKLDSRQAKDEGGYLYWNNLLVQAPVLVGFTELLMPAGRPGITPVIQYGDGSEVYSVKWLENGTARVTLPVKGKGDESNIKGNLSFTLKVAGVIITTRDGTRQGFSAISTLDDRGNGLPPADNAADFVPALSQIKNVTGTVTPQWMSANVSDGGKLALYELSRPVLRAIGAAYASEIVSGTGILSFAEGEIPRSWEVILPVTVTYQ